VRRRGWRCWERDTGTVHRGSVGTPRRWRVEVALASSHQSERLGSDTAMVEVETQSWCVCAGGGGRVLMEITATE
jgi:hypothetical protein